MNIADLVKANSNILVGQGIQYVTTMLPTMENKGDEKQVQECALDLLKKINSVATVASGGVIYPLTSQRTGNKTYIVPNKQGQYTVAIPSIYLIALSGGPYTLKISTGLAGKTYASVPILPAGDSATNKSLLFGIYIDSVGNVIYDSRAAMLYGYNAAGSYIRIPMASTGGVQICSTPGAGVLITMSGTQTNTFGTTSGNLYSGTATWTYPISFNGIPSVSVGLASGSSTTTIFCPYQVTANLIGVRGFNSTLNDPVYMCATAYGFYNE